MNALSIHIIAEGDPPPCQNLQPPLKEELTIEVISLLEKGMMSGATSLCFLLKGRDAHYTAQLTPALFKATAAALDAAQKRFGA